MSSDSSNLRRQFSGRRPNMQGRRLHGALLPVGALPATPQSHVFEALTDFNGAANSPWWSPAMLLVPSVGTSFELQLQHILPMPSSRPVPFIRQNAQSYPEDSKLSREEQKQSLQKLRRETYKPSYMYTQTARMVSRVGQYYQGRPVTSEYENDRGSNGDKCAICLEEFEPREEVTVTPCSHMFHDECIVPWVRSNGQCPVCRFVFYERRQQRSRQPFVGDNEVAPSPISDINHVFTDELMSIVRAMDGGFERGRYL
uniref:RING-type E3 ubiquitin transferase n=1 Tax=Kalanchoe fedtschenkoi TaxID=63787 RepID=A0A7N0T2W1_KALFE